MYSHLSVVFKLGLILKYLPNSFELQQNFSSYTHMHVILN